MKKQLKGLVGAIILLVSLQLVSCKKDPATPPVPKPLPAKPTVSVSKQDTALNGGTVTTVLAATNAQYLMNKSDGKVIAGGVLVVSGVTKDTTIIVVAYNNNENGTSTDTLAVVNHAFSVNSSKMELNGKVHQALRKQCIAGNEHLANPGWTSLALSTCDSAFFKANHTGVGIAGPCRAHPGDVTSNPVWNWTDNTETAIDFSGGGVDVWTITFIPNGFIRTQTKNGFFTWEEYHNY